MSQVRRISSSFKVHLFVGMIVLLPPCLGWARIVRECGHAMTAAECIEYEVPDANTTTDSISTNSTSTNFSNTTTTESTSSAVTPYQYQVNSSSTYETGRVVSPASATTTPASTSTTAAAAAASTDTTPPSNTPNTSSDDQTDNSNSAADEAVASCKADAEKAESSCMSDRNSGMSTLMTTLDGFAQQLSAMSTSATQSTFEICQQMAQTAGAANASLAALKMSCSMSADTCSSSCQTDFEKTIKELPSASRLDYRRQVTDARRQCSRAKSRLQGIQQNIAATMQSYQKSQACVSDVGNGLPLLAQCVANPNIQGCGQVLPQNCANPTFAAANLACTCLATQNRDSRCAQFNSASLTPNGGGTDGVGGSGSVDAASSLASSGSLGGALSDSGNLGGALGEPTDGAGGKPSSLAAGLGGGGGGGSGGRLGGAQPPDNRAKGGAPHESRFNSDVIKGYVGGAPAGALGGKALGPAGDGTYSKTGAWIPPKVTANPNAINFERFKPKSDLVIREVSSQVGGQVAFSNVLLGPHVDIWRTVNSRYTILRPTLTP